MKTGFTLFSSHGMHVPSAVNKHSYNASENLLVAPRDGKFQTLTSIIKV